MFMMTNFHRVLHDAFILLPSFILVFTMRGFSKAFAAKLNGDQTAAEEGFLSLNPLAHIDLIGLVVFVGLVVVLGMIDSGFLHRSVLFAFLAIVGVRWTYEVPMDASRFRRHTAGVISTSLAGPIGNFVLALLGMYAFAYVPRLGMHPHVLMPILQIVQNTLQFSIFFGVLDLVPIPPFDGGRLLPYLLPSRLQYVVPWLEERALFVFLFLFVVPVVSDFFFVGLNTAATTIFHLLAHLVF